MLSKAQVLKTIEELPDQFTPDELIDKIMLLYELQKAMDESKKGELLSSEDVKKEILGTNEKTS